MSNDSNKVKLIYDICSLPNEMNLNDFVYVWKKYGFVLYDSTKSESVPRVFSEKDIDSKSILVDISKADKEVLSKIQNLLKNVK